MRQTIYYYRDGALFSVGGTSLGEMTVSLATETATELGAVVRFGWPEGWDIP